MRYKKWVKPTLPNKNSNYWNNMHIKINNVFKLWASIDCRDEDF